MPVTVVVGGQFGGEGKGKVAHYFAKEQEASAVVRCGGSNSGHTVVASDGKIHIFRHLPTAAILPDVKLFLSAGSYIDIDVLFEEISSINLPSERLTIDENAVIVTSEHKAKEREQLTHAISSTGSGTGAAVATRVMRSGGVTFAKDSKELSQFIGHASGMMRDLLNANERILIEGTQGFGLSLLHSPYYPFVTGRDTTAAAFISEAGLSPRDVDDIVLTLRAFPIRVGGNSGPLPNEITWKQVCESAGQPYFMEHTSVTKKPRRIAKFDPNIVQSAIDVNQPSLIVMNHIDYFNSNTKVGDCIDGVRALENMLGCRLDFIGTGQKTLVDRACYG